MTLSDKLYTILIKGGSWKTILGGLWVTIQISALALLLGTVLGAIVCLLRARCRVGFGSCGCRLLGRNG